MSPSWAAPIDKFGKTNFSAKHKDYYNQQDICQVFFGIKSFFRNTKFATSIRINRKLIS
ncbi:hypothetical protein SAMN05216233_11341 [Desulfoluna spongiiphila]|uniref:Uncharacterized protein n=1 Tax=Desulfoluna spongiiphila TaxID=419481 RepID=A0A1G5HAP8_9BACT|nr:hypothetical protein SAMN05216233_11341 [Desulfoluna spongiiphila]